MINIKAFRAVDKPEDCEKFITGHTRVLENIGVQKVTSSRHEWMYNPNVFVIVVEDSETGSVMGGSRVQVAGGTQDLPIEDATGFMDLKVYDLIKQHAIHGTGEICGLWNSREVSGMGIGSVFLTRASVTIASQIGLTSLFALCAPYTVSMAKNVGYQIEESVGNKGTFYYPKLDLLATVMVLKDVNTLSLADPMEYQSIMELRKRPIQNRIEVLRGKEIALNFQLEIPNIDQWKQSGSITDHAKAS